MKSAYELAMERLKEAEPERTPLTNEQKVRLAELKQHYKAKIAERQVFLDSKIKAEKIAGNREEAEAVARQLREEKIRLEEEMEAKAEKIRLQSE